MPCVGRSTLSRVRAGSRPDQHRLRAQDRGLHREGHRRERRGEPAPRRDIHRTGRSGTRIELRAARQRRRYPHRSPNPDQKRTLCRVPDIGTYWALQVQTCPVGYLTGHTDRESAVPEVRTTFHGSSGVGLTARFSNPETPGHSPEKTEDPTNREEDLAVRQVREPRQTQERLQEAEILKLIEQYIQGCSTVELARRWEIHRDTVVAHLESYDVTRRPRRNSALRRFVQQHQATKPAHHSRTLAINSAWARTHSVEN